jgi:putative MATE family efflux protein
MTLQKQSQVTNEILQGNLVKLMFKLSIPSILGILMLSLNTFFDALFAGQFIGTNALAGISLALPLTGIVDGFALLIGVGSASVLSRAIGSGDIKTQSKLFGNLTVMGIVISFLITIIGYSFSEELIVFMGGSGEVASAGTEYFKIYILGSIFYILALSSSEIIKAEGKIRLATGFELIFVLINIILNSIFITVFHWGIEGIAIATVIAMVFYSIFNFTYFLSGKSSTPINLKKLALAIDLLPAIFSVGISSLLFPIMGFIQNFVIYQSISHYGTNNDIAFFGATVRLTSFFLIPLYGIAQALQPIIGINYGAKNYHRLKKAYLTFAAMGVILLILIWLPLQLLPKTFLGLLLPDVIFTKNDIFNFRILSLLIPIWPLAIFGNTLFQSIGKGKIVVTVILLRSLLLFLPFVLIMSKILGLIGIYYGIFLTEFLVGIIALILICLEFRTFSQITNEKLSL